MAIDDRGCRCTRTRRPRSGRGSSSRATSSSTCSRARRAPRTSTTASTIKVTQTATPVQLDQVLTSLQSDTRQDLRDVLEGLGTALRSKPTAADDRDADPSARGETAAKSWNDAYDVRRPGRARPGRRSTRRSSARSPSRDLARLIDGAARTVGGARPQRVRARGPDRQLQPHDGRVRLRGGEPERLDQRAGADARDRQRGVRVAQRSRSRPRARSRCEILPGVRETAATIDAAFPWIEQVSALMGQPELGGLLDDLTPATRDLARGHRRVARPAAADRPALQVRARRPAADRERRDPRRVPDRPRELQGLLLRDGRARRRGPELRRQRRLRALPDRRRRPAALVRPRRQGLPAAVRRAADAAARATGPRCPAASPPFDDGKPCYKQTPPDLNGPAARKTAPINAGGSTTAVKDAGQLREDFPATGKDAG